MNPCCCFSTNIGKRAALVMRTHQILGVPEDIHAPSHHQRRNARPNRPQVGAQGMHKCAIHLMVCEHIWICKTLCLPLREVLSKMEDYLFPPVICVAFTSKALKNKKTSPFFEIIGPQRTSPIFSYLIKCLPSQVSNLVCLRVTVNNVSNADNSIGIRTLFTLVGFLLGPTMLKVILIVASEGESFPCSLLFSIKKKLFS